MRWLRRVQTVDSANVSTEHVVIETLVQFLDPGTEVGLMDHLLDDLALVSDDLSKIAVMLEESFALVLHSEAYHDVNTVQDLVALFENAREGRQP